MDKKSKKTCTLSTYFGLFQTQRLLYGVASSPTLWKKAMNKIFNGLEIEFCFIDDALITGRDGKEHYIHLKAVFERMTNVGLRGKKEKCQFNISWVKYLGFKIDQSRIQQNE